MSIQEQVGYPDYILEEGNKHLDKEYSNVRATHTAPPVPWPQPNPPLSQLPRTLGPQLPGVDSIRNSATWPRAGALASPPITGGETMAGRDLDLAR